MNTNAVWCRNMIVRLYDLWCILTSDKYLTKLLKKISIFINVLRVCISSWEHMHWSAVAAETGEEGPATSVLHRMRSVWLMASRNSWSGRVGKTVKGEHWYREGFSQHPRTKSKQLRAEQDIPTLSFWHCWCCGAHATSPRILVAPSGEVEGAENKEQGKDVCFASDLMYPGYICLWK